MNNRWSCSQKIWTQTGQPTAKHKLAGRLVARGEHEEAIEVCLALIKQDRAWNEEAGKVLLMKIFDSLGNGDALTKRGRRKFANMMFS
ncbi:Tetratricopeptide repeat-domain-containing protein [Pavlovales sp. CCMP2436]|nr:Tetratricopeptide repeat-domain-containing protein [Pavlovales sp. CCMP2436]